MCCSGCLGWAGAVTEPPSTGLLACGELGPHHAAKRLDLSDGQLIATVQRMGREEEHVLHRRGLLCLQHSIQTVLGRAEQAKGVGDAGGLVGGNRLRLQRIGQI